MEFGNALLKEGVEIEKIVLPFDVKFKSLITKPL